MMIDRVNHDPRLQDGLPPLEDGWSVPVMTHTTITTTHATSAGITVAIPTSYAVVAGGAQP